MVRFRSVAGDFWGEFEPDGIVPLIGDPFGSFRRDSLVHQHGDVTLLAPVKPSKIVCVGLNYADH
ncbi:MAG: Rv2993c-like domain-containing protein, partial [Candidatus Zixiibacteriota bacterium]